MTLAELIARENPVRHCQECGRKFDDGDWVDYYCKVCQSCFAKWESSIGTYLLRYDFRGTVCAACGLTFGGGNFSKHRKLGRCLSPSEMKAVVKDGIVVSSGCG
jgi:NMD protein affecting ribosome stability and mRNA decay